MLKRRLIPKLQLGLRKTFRGTQPVLVVTNKFSSRRAIGDPLSQAKIFEAQLADELVLVDLERIPDSWPILLSVLESMSQSLATPLTVGGGLRSFEQVQILLDRGADKVILNTAALQSPDLIDMIARRYGSQCVVLSIDVSTDNSDIWHVWSDGGCFDTGLNVFEWVHEAEQRGVGEVLVTSITRDGSGEGLDLDLIHKLAQCLSVPLIASGGCGLSQHFVEGYEAGASAVAAGTFFSQRDQNPMQCRSHIRNAGFPIRLEV